MTRTLLLILMVWGTAVGSADVLFLGNSRGDYINKSVITTGLGYSTYYSGAVGGFLLYQMMDSLEADIDSCIEDSIKAIVFIDCINEYKGGTINNSYREMVVLLDSIVKRCVQVVGNGNVYFCHSSTQRLYKNPSDHKVPLSIWPSINKHGCREKDLYQSALEYEIAAKYRVRWCSVYDYFCLAQIDSADYPDINGFYNTSDLIHYSDRGNDSVISSIINHSRLLTTKNIVFGSGMEGSWKVWHRPNGAVITGDTNTGSITMETGDSLLSPIKCIGYNQKTITITPYYASGSGTVYVRYSDEYFYRNNTAISWMSIDSNVTIKNFCQFMIVSAAGATVDSINFRWSNKIATRTNHKKFGLRTGMIGVYNKDTWLRSDNHASYGSDSLICATNVGLNFLGLFRFGLDYEIPRTATVDSAKLHMFVSVVLPASTARFYPLVTNNGPCKYWDDYSTAEGSPKDQATFWFAKQNTVRWATTGDTIGPTDYGASLDSAFTKGASASKGTELIANVKNLVQSAINDTGANLGWLLKWVSGSHMYIYSQQATAESNRPYLEVWYSTTEQKRSTGNNKTRVSLDIGL